MAFNYPSNPAGSAGTIPAPAKHAIPTATGIPSDGDAANAASVNPPGFETAMDWIGFLNVQGALGDALGGAATSFDGPANPTAWNDMLTADGAPISGLDVLPTFAAGSGFNITIGAGSGYLNTSVGIGPGESNYRTIFWAGQTLAIATPDGANARIDAVTVTPAAFGTASVLAVVAGAPASPPLAPSAPSGSGVLFYVLVPAAVADATHFRACRGLWRRVGYPWSGMSAIVAGAELSWDYTADPAAASSAIAVGIADQTGSNITVNRVLIDGEMLEWTGYGSSSAGNIVSDSTANPFGSTASANFDRPYYVYACGGRHNPLPSTVAASPFLVPVTFCESTVAPNPKTGKPTGNLTVNGVTVTPNGAIYIGLGFVVANTVFRRGCLMDGDMTYSLNGLGFLGVAAAVSGKIDMGTFAGQCQPAISTKMFLSASFVNSAGAGSECGVFLEDFPTTVADSGIRGYAPGPGEERFNYVPLSFGPRFGSELWAQLSSGNGVIQLYAMGFDHRVRRVCGGY